MYRIPLRATFLSTLIFVVACSSEPQATQPPKVILNPETVLPKPTVSPSENTPTTPPTLKHIIQTAERHTKANAVEIQLHQNGLGNPVYDVETRSNTREYHVQIDSVTGQVLSSYDEMDMGVRLTYHIDLAQAIALAQHHVKGQFIEASLDDDITKPHYEVQILSEQGHPFTVRIHAKTGEIISSRIEFDD